MEVEGLGDYLPKYAGNLDIMTAAALRTGEMFAEQMLQRRALAEAPAMERESSRASRSRCTT